MVAYKAHVQALQLNAFCCRALGRYWHKAAGQRFDARRAFGAKRTNRDVSLRPRGSKMTPNGPQRAQKGYTSMATCDCRFKLVVIFDRNGVDP